jgi:hypothetical protein
MTMENKSQILLSSNFGFSKPRDVGVRVSQ